MEYVSYGPFVILCAIVSAKWALELGFSQLSQFIWGIGALIFGPFIPLILYVRLVRKAKSSWFSEKKEEDKEPEEK